MKKFQGKSKKLLRYLAFLEEKKVPVLLFTFALLLDIILTLQNNRIKKY